MNTAAIDFETYYDKDISIKTMGVMAYVSHPKTKAYMVSVATNTGVTYVGDPKRFDWGSISGDDWTWVSHNAAFDMAVHAANEFGGKPKNWFCTANMSVYLGGPRDLKTAAKEFLNEEMSKDVRDKMKGKLPEDLSESDMQDLADYALKDAVNCLRLWLENSYKWPLAEALLGAHTALMQFRGIPVNKGKLETMRSNLEALRWEALNEIPWADTRAPLSPKALAESCLNAGIPCPKSLAADSEECRQWEDTYGDQYPWVNYMRTYRRSNALLAKVTTMCERIREDGTIPVSLKYGGAHTLRWSGDAGINWHNLPREEIMGADLRSVVEAPDGFVFINADQSQIEPRCTAWLTGDRAMLQLMQDPDSDLYEIHARLTMGYNNPRRLEDVDTLLRRLAKARVLGLTYGCGAEKFQVVAKLMAGLELTPEECYNTVLDFRRTNPLITGYWEKLERHMKSSALANEDAEYELPSGRSMRYLKPASMGRSLSAVIRRGHGLMRVKLWGGSLMENIVQATARDVFAEGVLNLELSGIPVLLHTHDEVLCLAKEDEANEVAREVEKIMMTTPTWMPGLPLKVKAKIMKVYSK